MVVPAPTIVIPPGVLVNVQLPVAGNPLKITLPVANAHVGCVIAPTVGANGIVGWVLITILAEVTEVQPD